MDATRRPWPRADLRVGDSDRKAVVTELQRHYVEGRLSSEELGERVSEALNARTVGDLATLLSDLPMIGEPAEQGRLSAGHDPDHWHRSGIGPPVGALLVIMGVLMLVMMF